MSINVRTNISQDYGEDIEIVVNTSKYTKEVGEIIETIHQIASKIDAIIGKKGNEISVIGIEDIICFYSNEQNNYCKTSKGEFVVKQKLYELEESLPKNDFIRISNSTIINIKFVECFDVSIIGNILVKFKDGSTEYVSKRRVSRSNEIFERKREEIIMGKVLKNMFKSISITCFIIVIVVTVFSGIRCLLINDWINIENNGEIPILEDSENIVRNFIGIAEDEPIEDKEAMYKRFISYAIAILPTAITFEIMLNILFYSIIIGGIIGIAISVNEFSEKRMIITYIGTYIIMLLLLYFIDREGYITTYYISNGMRFAVKFFIIYTFVFGLAILGKRVCNKSQSKMMNKELNVDDGCKNHGNEKVS